MEVYSVKNYKIKVQKWNKQTDYYIDVQEIRLFNKEKKYIKKYSGEENSLFIC